MSNYGDDFDLAEMVDGSLMSEPTEVLLGADPERAAEVEIARRVRGLMIELRAAAIEVPEDFEARLLERVSNDKAVLDLLELSWSGLGRVLLELLNLLFGMMPPTAEVAEA